MTPEKQAEKTKAVSDVRSGFLTAKAEISCTEEFCSARVRNQLSLSLTARRQHAFEIANRGANASRGNGQASRLDSTQKEI